MIIKNNSEVRKIYFGTSPAPMLNYNGSKAWQHIVDEYVPPVFTCPDVVQSWVNGVAPSGTFVKNRNATWTTTGESGVPNGWTVELSE